MTQRSALEETVPADARGDWTFGGTWPYEPRWFTSSDGVRLHYVDEGRRDSQPVVLLHGNPTWGYLYRNFISALVGAGFRAIAHDEMGFGRSDKPEAVAEYTVQRHAQHFRELVDELGLQGVTLVLQDWGGPIGLAWAVENADRVRRLVLLNTFSGLSIPDYLEPPAFFRLLRSPRTGPLLIQRLNLFTKVILFRGGVVHRDRLGERERAAYLAPHPTPDSRAGVLAYPRLIPWDDGNPTIPLGRHVEDNLAKLVQKPVLICWPTKDRGFRAKTLAFWRGRFPGAEVHELEAGHYIQEDAHERVTPVLVDWLGRTS